MSLKTACLKLLFTLFLIGLAGEGYAQDRKSYQNPVIPRSIPDPTVIRLSNGRCYLYGTEDIRNVPIYRSDDMVHWYFVGTAFTNETRPTFEPNGGIWAPDINYIDGKYVLYYSMSVWGGEWTCGIGVAVADSPEGPFTDRGPLFRSNEIGVQNSIDQFYWEEKGKKYLFWGSFHGIYGIELTDDGLAVKEGAKPRQIAGTATEGTYIHKRNGYYYLFGSVGTCCEGANSTYRTVYGRSRSLWGPYLNKRGESMSDNKFEVLIKGNSAFVGTGHNSEFIKDDAGHDWIFYHAFPADEPDKGRVVLMDRVDWHNDWPSVERQEPSLTNDVPVIYPRDSKGRVVRKQHRTKNR